MKSVEHVLTEPTPSTVNYRNDGRRLSLQNLIDRGINRARGHPNSAVNSVIGNGKVIAEETTMKKGQKLNWRNGVFIPVLLNIWGVIMFLRLGWVVGHAGLIVGTVIVLSANLVTFLTALSLCAICTNGEVQGGGVYFLISRALGPVDGGTIGLLFFIAQAVAVSLYVVGFAESVVNLYVDQGADYFTGSEVNDIRVIGFATNTVLLMVAMVGIGWYAKTQSGLLVVLLVAIFSVLLGAFFPQIPNRQDNLLDGFIGFGNGAKNYLPNFQVDPGKPGEKQSFFSVFAVYFPAVTGIMAGANLSGDLDDPSTAIPKGTMLAIAVTLISYLLLLWFVGLTCLTCTVDPGVTPYSIANVRCDFEMTLANVASYGDLPVGGLLYDPLIMRKLSLWEPLLYIGVFAATLSSALASLVGAPRILQSVASDRLFPCSFINIFAAGRGPQNEPIRGYLLTYVIACACVAIGNLDLIAPIISNFFMISYCLTNYACFYSSQTNAPNWRPSFKYYSKYASGLGAIICLVVMFLIDWIPALITVIFAGVVWLYLTFLDPTNNWGEAGEAAKYSKALKSLETLQLSRKVHVKTFRPQFLVMTGNIFQRLWLVKFVSLFQSGGGIMICADIIPRPEVYSSPTFLTPFCDESNKMTENMGDEMSPGAISGAEKHDMKADYSSNPKSLARQGTGSVVDLFGPSLTIHARPAGDAAAMADYALMDEDSDSGNSNLVDELHQASSKINSETAKFLGAELEVINKRREEGENLLSNKIIWNARKCQGAFYEAIISSSLFGGFQKLLQLAGIGKMRPNTLVIGFKSSYRMRPLAEIADYERLLRSTLSANFGLVVVRDDDYLFDINLKEAAKSFLPKFGKKILARSEAESNADEGLPNSLNRIFDQEFNSTEKNGDQPAEDTAQDVSYQNDVTRVHFTAKDEEFKDRAERYRAQDNAYILKYENDLATEVKGEFIDVWWLADDGGLTMLLPQLLSKNYIFKKKKLRVMAVTNKFQNPEETSRLKKTELRMIRLLNKFRIKATTIGVEVNIEQDIMAGTKRRFEDCMGIQITELDSAEQSKTKYNLRVAEEIRRLSRNSAMVFVIIPLPDISLRVKLHTVWCDMMSCDMPPMIMMRGNNANVLTFFC